MSQPPTRSRTRMGAAAGLLGALAAFTAVSGVGPAPSIFQLTGAVEDVRGNCDEAEHAGDAACAGSSAVRGGSDDDSSSTSSTSSTLDDSSTSTTAGNGAPTDPGSGSDIRTVSAGAAGSVMVAVEGSTLRLLSAAPGQGWRAEVEQAAGREIEVTFESGSRRVDVNVELEDGQVRERVRTRNDATGTETRTENGVVVRDEGPDDSSGSGSSGHGSDDSDDRSDDSSGHGRGGDDDSDDDDSSGHGSDDVNDDSSGHGSDNGPNHD
jgi:hypothetical protein